MDHAYPVEILRVDEVRREERRQPREEVAYTDSRPNGPGPQSRADEFRRRRIRRVAHERVIREEIDGGERDQAAPSGGRPGRHRCGNGEAEHRGALDDRAGHEDGAPAHDVAHQIHADVDADESQHGVHEGELEGLVDGEPGDDHEVRGVADDEPRPRPRLRRDDAVA